LSVVSSALTEMQVARPEGQPYNLWPALD